MIHPSSFVIHPCSSAGLVVEVDGDVHDLQKEEDERREKVLPLSVRWTSPPNTTMEIWSRIERLNRRIWGRLGDEHFPATGTLFILHHSSLLFGNDEVMMAAERSAVVGK
ncbi:DUF559 domain-containing protein [Chloroflexi bacterium CFX6]|nr:DUF559 domain-containing protein [Chloroflexi bacterium CFX6]